MGWEGASTGSIIISQRNKEIETFIKEGYLPEEGEHGFILDFEYQDDGLRVCVIGNPRKSSYSEYVQELLQHIVKICKKEHIKIEGKLTFYGEDHFHHIQVQNYEVEQLMAFDDILGSDLTDKIRDRQRKQYKYYPSYRYDVSSIYEWDLQVAIEKMQAKKILKETSLCDDVINVIGSFI